MGTNLNDLTPALSFGEGVTAFPNPVNESLTVNLQNPSSGHGAIEEISIYDLLGEEVLNIPAAGFITDEIKIDCRQLNPGIYMLKLEGYPDMNFMFKFSVQR